jgi:hypothetical protein
MGGSRRRQRTSPARDRNRECGICLLKQNVCAMFFREQDGPTPLLARACWREEKERLRRSVRNLKHEFEAEKIFLFGLAVTH